MESEFILDNVPIGLIIFLVVLIGISAFFSSAEMAFSSVNKIRLRNYLNEGRKGSKKAIQIADNFDNALTTILVGNNLVNIAATSISTAVITNIIGGSAGLIISTVVMTIIILIFGEILPKSFAKEHAEPYALKVSGITFLIIKLFTPINYFFTKLKQGVTKVFTKNKEKGPSVTEEEIKVLVDISEQEGVINKDEKELLHRSLDFNEIVVGEVLTHRMHIVAVEVNQPVEEITEILLEERYSRIPVYEGDIDNVIGFLSEREFFAELLKNKKVVVRDLLRNPIFVVKSMKVSTLLPELQRTKSHMAIVLDEFGGTAGLITMEDILEELVGEIWDEHDEKTNNMVKISDTVYEFDAQYHLDDFADLLNIKVPESSYYNISGWLFESLARIPEQGEEIQYENLKVTILEAENNRLQKVRVEILPEEDIIENEVEDEE